MAPSVTKLVIIAPFVAASTCVWATDSGQTSSPFGFDAAELSSIQFTRSKTDSLGLSSDDTPGRIDRSSDAIKRQTEFSFKLKPKRPDFSSSGGFGLSVFSDTELEINNQSLSFPGFKQQVIPMPNDGLEYSAGFKIEQEEADIGGSAYISSSMLGLSYGRLGRLWYGGIDVNLEQFDNNFYGTEQSDVLSLDVTTGRRLGFTGLSTHSPLWLLSVQGNIDVDSGVVRGEIDGRNDWYLNPSLFWQQPGFTFSAQMQVPVQFETLNDEGEPDYRLRAVFEKQFK